MEASWDVIVIGAGPAGYTAAIRACQYGLSVLVVERSEVGGTCLNRGCIPSKALIHCARVWQTIQEGRRWGISVEGAKLDWRGMQGWSMRVVTTLRRGLKTLLKRHGVTIRPGEAKVIAPDAVQVQGDREETVFARAIILATGSQPILLPHDPDAPVLNEEEALFLEELPGDMVIIGGGPTGVELAWLFNAVGVSVSLVEMLPRLLPFADAEVSEGLKQALERQGVKVWTGEKVVQIRGENGKAVVFLEGGKTLRAGKVICAVGRRPLTESLSEVPLDQTPQGFLSVNEWGQTSVSSIFAVGDLVHGGGTAHGGMEEGARAAKAINRLLRFGLFPDPEPFPVIPFCVFSFPQVLKVGLTEGEARERGYRVVVSHFPWRACGAAVVTGETEGFVKVIMDAASGHVLGIHILGDEAVNLSGEAALIVSQNLTGKEAVGVIRQHPSLSEGIGESLWGALGIPLHLLPGWGGKRGP